ncbi:MAG: hypothetical protein JXR83_06215, partial [Deltaproteobacteria bacterium]|nr:hypothetical protein [Deltaproteobacteria bacterium]
RIGYLQLCPRFGAVEANRRAAVEALERAVADLIVLPELCFTGYLFRDRRELRDLAEDPADSATVRELIGLCRRRRLHLVAGFAERDRRRLFNSALLIGPRGVVGRYRKLHLFMREKQLFDPGDRPPPVFSVRGARVGLMICFDWALPEVARSLALAGADVICHPSNLVLGHCQRAMLTRSLENGVYAITANRCGSDRRPHGSVRFTGRSQIAGPRGELIHRAPAQRRELYLVDVDLRRARDKALTPFNDLLADRRPRYYRLSPREGISQ